jgi:hypothetical protein
MTQVLIPQASFIVLAPLPVLLLSGSSVRNFGWIFVVVEYFGLAGRLLDTSDVHVVRDRMSSMK